MRAEVIKRAIEALEKTDPTPYNTTIRDRPYTPPRLTWWCDEDDPQDAGGWIVEMPGFGVVHPYAYVDMVGEDDPLSREIIAKTDYRNRKNADT